MILEHIISEYQNHQFPDDGLKKSIKNSPDFFNKVAHAMLSQYFDNRCSIPYKRTKGRSISILRAYGKGEQDTNPYKPLLCSMLKGDKVYMNISWEAVRAIPKFRNVVKSIILKTAFDINVDTLDPSSITEKKAEEAYWRLQTNPEWIAFSKEMQKMGVNVPKQQFESEEQVDIWMRSGGLKLGVEIMAKTALEATLYLSKFDDSIKPQLADDLIDIGLIAVRDYVENGTRYVKSRYVDPEFYVGRFSQFLDHNNSDYGGEIRFMTISEIARESDLSQAELSQIANKYMKDYGNAHQRFGGGIYNTQANSRYLDTYGCSPIDDFKVPILDGIIISSDTSFYDKGEKEGVKYYTEIDEKELSKKKDVDAKRHDVIYKFKHIIGTDVVFNYGLDNDIAHDGPDGYKYAVNPYHVYKLGTSSIVDLLVGTEDDMCLSTYKWRNAKAKMIPPPAIAIEKGVLENLTLGGVKMTPMQSMSMGMETGYLVMQSLTDHGKAAISPGSTPIKALPNTAMDFFNVYVQDMNFNFSKMREVTGINDLTAGGDPQSRQGLGVAEIAIAASSNALYPLMKAYEILFEQTMRSCIKRWQSILRNGDVKGHYKSFGQTNLQVFELTKDMSLADLGIIIQVLPTEQERELLLQEIIQLKSANVTSGQGGISPENYILIYRTIKSGNLDLAYLQLSWAVSEQRKTDQRLALEREKALGDVQQQSAQASILGKQAEMEQEWGYEKEKMTLQADIDRKSDERKHEYALEEIEAKGNEATEQKLIGSQTDLTKEIIKSTGQKDKQNNSSD